MATEDKSKRKVWTVVEIKGLLKCYLARKEEFLHARKKRNAYAHVLEDMVAQGFTDPSTTPVERKMRTLLSAYKCAKDNASRTAAAPCIAPYMDEMAEIFGNSALLSNNHTLIVGRCRAQPLGTPPPPQQADSPQPALPPRPIALSLPARSPQPSLPHPPTAFSQPTLPHRPTAQPSRSLLLAPPPSPAPSAHPARSLFLVPSQRPAVSHTASALSAYPTSPIPRASQHPITSHLAAASPYTELRPQPISPQPAVSPSPPTSPHPESSQQPPSHEAESRQPVTSKRRRKTARERYYEEKLILKERKLEEKKIPRFGSGNDERSRNEKT